MAMMASNPDMTGHRVSVRFPLNWKQAISERAQSRGSDFSAYLREAAFRFMEQEGITPSND